MQKYIIKQKIGSGSFGQVFLIHDPKRNEKLALKKIKTHYDSQQQIKDLIEVKILTKLKHPNLIDLKQAVYEKESQKGNLIFQYCYSDILKKFCFNKKQRAPEIQIKKIMFQIASALSFIHSKNYIHRDLKPENILLQEKQLEGKFYDVAKLCDFGISKKAEDLPLTEYIGTRWYRAPQLLIKMKNYTKAIDIFSLGCIMAEMYNHKILFQGKTSSEQLYLILKHFGTPTKQSWSQFSNWCKFKGIIFGKHQRSQDTIIFKAKPYDLAQDLVQKMLVMNPKNRITALDILKHPYFNDIRPQMVARQYAAQPQKLSNIEQSLGKKQQVFQENIKQTIKVQSQNGKSDKAQSESRKSDRNPIQTGLLKDQKDEHKIQNQEKQPFSVNQYTKVSIPKLSQAQMSKKPPAYYSPYSSNLSKQSTSAHSNKQFDYFKTYVSGKKNQDRIRTTYELQKNQNSRDSSFKNNALQISGK